MMTCEQFENALREGEMSPDAARHVAHCPGCAVLQQESRRLEDALSGLLVPRPADPTLREAILRRVPAGDSGAAAPASAAPGRPWRPVVREWATVLLPEWATALVLGLVVVEAARTWLPELGADLAIPMTNPGPLALWVAVGSSLVSAAWAIAVHRRSGPVL